MKKIFLWLFRANNKYFIIFLLIAFYYAGIYLSLCIFPLPAEKLENDYSQVYLDKDGGLLRISLSKESKYRVKLKLDDISGYIKKGFIIYEDKYFYYHGGINPVSAVRAFYNNTKYGRKTAGASTITMQIAKIMEHNNRKRSFILKIAEAFRALQLEARYSKKELFEIYLNTVPMGGNIEGVGAASYLYFGKPAKDLSFGQSALLISIPKSPSLNRPDICGSLSKTARACVLDRIYKDMNINENGKEHAKLETVPKTRFVNPFTAPNLVLRTRRINSNTLKNTTIDLSLQKYCENIMKTNINKLKKHGVYNGAMIIVDNNSMNVTAYVGSVNFNDKDNSGQINGAYVKRSPGSLLKPFLYARGVEKGLITPKKIIFDIERNYDGYAPANYLRKYLGCVTALDSLVWSLNVPAVNLEFDLKKEGLYGFLKDTRLLNIESQNNNPGLSLVLGSYAFSLEDMVKLYACLANKGVFRELKFLREDFPNTGKRILSEEACFLISDMLSQTERPDLPQCWEFTSNRGKVAFKTGTSFGLKDAWCIGYNPDYTIGVWFGNMNCKGSPSLTGFKTSAPVVVEAFNYLTRYKDSWYKKPAGIEIRDVCAISGEPSGIFCKKILNDYFIPGVSAVKVCSVHKSVKISKKDNFEVCGECMNGRLNDYTEKIYEVRPPDISTYLRKNGNTNLAIPPHNPLCSAIDRDKNLRIKSPLKNGHYVICKALPSEKQKIALKAECNTNSEEIYWKVDDILFAKGSPDKIFFINPDPGIHTVTVMNLKGQIDTVTIKIAEEQLLSNQ